MDKVSGAIKLPPKLLKDVSNWISRAYNSKLQKRRGVAEGFVLLTLKDSPQEYREILKHSLPAKIDLIMDFTGAYLDPKHKAVAQWLESKRSITFNGYDPDNSLLDLQNAALHELTHAMQAFLRSGFRKANRRRYTPGELKTRSEQLGTRGREEGVDTTGLSTREKDHLKPDEFYPYIYTVFREMLKHLEMRHRKPSNMIIPTNQEIKVIIHKHDFFETLRKYDPTRLRKATIELYRLALQHQKKVKERMQ